MVKNPMMEVLETIDDVKYDSCDMEDGETGKSS